MAWSENERVMLKLFIVKHDKFAWGALVHVAATAVEYVVKLGHTRCLLYVSAGSCSFLYRQFGNFGALIRPRIGLTAFFVDLIRVFFGQATALRGRDSGVGNMSAWNWAGELSIQKLKSVFEIPKLLHICSSVSEFAFVHGKVGDIPGCNDASCGMLPFTLFDEFFVSNFRLTFVKMYIIFQ